MWHEKHENFNVPGQATSPRGDYLSSKILPHPPGNCDVDNIDGSSRKRKSKAIDLPGTGSEYCFPSESNRQEFSSILGLNEQGSKDGVYVNKKKSAEQSTSRQQFHNHEPHYQNDFPEDWSTSNVTSYGSGIDKVSGASLSVPAHSSIMTTVGESIMVPNQQPWECHLSSQFEAHRSLSFPESCNAGSNAAQLGLDLQSLTRPRSQNCAIPDTMQQEICNSSSECLRPFNTLHQCFNHSNRFSEGLNGRSSDLPNAGMMAFLGASLTEQSENRKTLQTKLQCHSSLLGILLGNTFESKEQSPRDGIVKTKQKAAASEMMKSNNSLTKDFSSKNGISPTSIVENGQKNDLIHTHLKEDETNKLSSGKPSSAVAEKLWDGRVQLSSSVTMSAVAFFKSGEKLLDINWSDFVEVKGKVRLEAFEKYIQDLPRSRNRGLMVISLCWKEGSSGNELTGMKEVSKGYRKGGRVGFAQLSAGIDLYICPRSDTIITILAKYGFFKGMAAIEDNQDSLIGCVVWRKSQFSSNSVTKNLDSKNNSSSEQPLDSISGSLTHQVAEKKLAQPAQQINQSTPLVTVVSSPSLESAAENGRECKKIESSEIQLVVSKSSSAASSPPTPSVPSNSSAIQMGQQMFAPSYEPCQGSNGRLLEVETSSTAISGEQSKISSEKKNDIIAVQSNAPKAIKPTFDEDDLPEYDFGTACGVSATAYGGKHVDVSLLNRKLPAEGIWTLDGLVSSIVPVVHARSAPNQRSDNVNLSRNHSAPNQGMPPPKTVCERVSENPLHHNLEEKISVQSKATPTPPAVSAFSSTKISCTMLPNKNKLFDDDDDMPEWCPPEPYKQSLGEASRPSTTLPSKLSNSSFKDISPVGPRLVILPPSPASTHSQFSFQPFRPALQVTTTISTNAPQPMPIRCSSSFSTGFNSRPALGLQSGPPQPMSIQTGPGFSTGFNPGPALKPQSSSLDIKPPFHFSGTRRDWRP